MRARTVRQRRVEAIHHLLPPITAAQVAWAKKRLFTHRVYATKGTMWCTECGQHWAGEPQVTGKKYICPKCGAVMVLEKSRKRKEKESIYFTILSVCREWQVVRHYIISRHCAVGHAAYYQWYECVQIWIDDTGHEVIVARPRNVMGFYYDDWRPNEPMSFKQRGCTYGDPYNIWAKIAPGGSITRRLRRNGYTRSCDVMPVDELMRLLLRDNRAETLIKQGQYKLLGELRHKMSAYNDYKPAINVMVRNGYRVSDVKLWLDYIDLLLYFKFDIHNAHYVCPARLKAEHDRLSVRRHKIEAAARRKAEAARLKEEQAAYVARVQSYLSLSLSLGNITARVLRSVEEFEAEGTAMSHCVFSNRYYNHPESLIFTVRDAEDQRIATVEVNVDRMEVVQCRGRCNSKPKRYADIIRMFECGMSKIQAAK